MSTRELRSELDDLYVRSGEEDGVQDRFDQVAGEYRERLREQVRNGTAHMEMAEFHDGGLGNGRSRPRDDGLMPVSPHVRAARDEGLRVIERFHKGPMEDDAADLMERLVRDHRDPTALTARYLRAVGDPDYGGAFAKYVAYGPQTASLHFSAAEHDAWQRVVAVEQERALNLSGASGGFAVPFDLDPTVMNTSAGALNPIRQLARVVTTNVDEWRGLSSAGVTAAYEPELTQVADQTPVFSQPTISTEKAHAWVAASIEVSGDWSTIQNEVLKMFSDARDMLDAGKFYNGTGTNEPAGIRTGLTTTQRVQTAGAGAVAVGDFYSLKQSIRPRDYANATWLLHPNRADTVYRFVGGNSTEPPLMNEARTEIAGYPFSEWTSVPTATTTGTTVALFGNVREAFVIVDRLGFSVDFVPTVFGAAQRPVGARGWYAYWRTGSKTVLPEAMRYLEVL